MTFTMHSLVRSVPKYFLPVSFLLFFVLYTPDVLAQEEITGNYEEFRGVIKDNKSGKVLEFATIAVANTNISTISNLDGAFLLKVPEAYLGGDLLVSYLGYTTGKIPLSSFEDGYLEILLQESFEKLPDVNLVEADPVKVINKVMENRRRNTLEEPLIVSAFYRESIKKRRTYASLSEAVIDIYKQPQLAQERDYVIMEKARKSTDYRKIDTLVIKLQGGPYNNLGMDMMRNKEVFFSEDVFEIYKFTFDKMISMNNRNVYVIDFVQRSKIVEPFYQGKLYIDAETFGIMKAVFGLNLENLNRAKRFFVKKKPPNADVIPLDTKYIVDYRMSNGKWHFNYSRIELSFKVKWDKKLFNSIYNIAIEMAVTDWKVNTDKETVKTKDRMRRNVILNDEASGFSDPSFWGERNVIEPDKSIDNAIRKIQRSSE